MSHPCTHFQRCQQSALEKPEQEQVQLAQFSYQSFFLTPLLLSFSRTLYFLQARRRSKLRSTTVSIPVLHIPLGATNECFWKRAEFFSQSWNLCCSGSGNKSVLSAKYHCRFSVPDHKAYKTRIVETSSVVQKAFPLSVSSSTQICLSADWKSVFVDGHEVYCSSLLSTLRSS